MRLLKGRFTGERRTRTCTLDALNERRRIFVNVHPRIVLVGLVPRGSLPKECLLLRRIAYRERVGRRLRETQRLRKQAKDMVNELFKIAEKSAGRPIHRVTNYYDAIRR